MHQYIMDGELAGCDYLPNLLHEVRELVFYHICYHGSTLGSIEDILARVVLKWGAHNSIAQLNK